MGLYDAIHFYDSDYEVLSFGTDIFRIVVIFAFIGAVLACVGAYYNAKVLGGLIRALSDANATDESSALTLEQLGMKGNLLLHHSLRDESPLRRYVKAREDVCGEDKKKKKPSELAFYLLPEKADVAKQRFIKKESGTAALIISIVVLAVILLVLLIYGPLLLQFIDNTAQSFSTGAQVR